MPDLKIIEGDGKIGQEKGTAIRDLRDRYLVEEEQSLGRLFVGVLQQQDGGPCLSYSSPKT